MKRESRNFPLRTILLSFLFPLVFASTIATTSATSTVAIANEQAVEFASSTFKGTPLMNIAYCESGLREFDETGSVLKGNVDQTDRGFMQINLRYHQQEAADLGLNLHSAYGNILFAKWLYEREGLQPWKASENCWGSDQKPTG